MISNILKNIGYNEIEIIEIIKTYDLKEYDKEEDLKELFTKFGYANKIYNKIINAYPISNFTSETLYYKVVKIYFGLLKLNYKNDKIIKMTTILPSLYGYSIERIKNRIKDMLDIGYTIEEVIKMTILFPNLYGFSIESIKNKIKDIMDIGYTKEEVIKMTILFPPLFSLSIENIKEKIDFYKEIEVQDIILTDTKRLIQSVALSYVRYLFLTSKGIIINTSSYSRLFCNQKQFASQYGVTTEELLQMYDYNEYKEKRENERNLQLKLK